MLGTFCPQHFEEGEREYMSHFCVIVPVSYKAFSKRPDLQEYLRTDSIYDPPDSTKEMYKEIEKILEREIERKMNPYYEGLEDNDNVDYSDVSSFMEEEYSAAKDTLPDMTDISYLEFLEHEGYTVLYASEMDLPGKDGPEMIAYIHDEGMDAAGRKKLIEELNEAPDSRLEVMRLEPLEPKWDWYQLGGRYKNSIPVEYCGKDGNMKVGNVYWCRVLNLRRETPVSKERYHEMIRLWAIINGEAEATEYEKRSIFLTPSTKGYYLERYGDLKTMIKEEETYSPYAFIAPDGSWHAKGGVGWFGATDATAETVKIYQKELDDMLDHLDSRDILVAVDCHI